MDDSTLSTWNCSVELCTKRSLLGWQIHAKPPRFGEAHINANLLSCTSSSRWLLHSLIQSVDITHLVWDPHLRVLQTLLTSRLLTIIPSSPNLVPLSFLVSILNIPYSAITRCYTTFIESFQHVRSISYVSNPKGLSCNQAIQDGPVLKGSKD